MQYLDEFLPATKAHECDRKLKAVNTPCRWWWRSFLCGGSTGIFVYGYCFYYYYARSDMNGFMQTSFFFGYNAVVCYAFFLMLGSVGFQASLLFVRHIYRCD